jgi:hypothetical protein
MAPPSLPRYRRHSLAPRGNRRQNRARVARPRVACHHAKIPRTLEGDREAARRNEAAVLIVLDTNIIETGSLVDTYTPGRIIAKYVSFARFVADAAYTQGRYVT